MYNIVATMRVVLDTSVIVAALGSRRGASNAVLGLVADRQLTPLATPALFLEYEDVLKRPEQRRVHGLSNDQIDRVLAALKIAAFFKMKPTQIDGQPVAGGTFSTRFRFNNAGLTPH